jgi:hypothetical protein
VAWSAVRCVACASLRAYERPCQGSMRKEPESEAWSERELAGCAQPGAGRAREAKGLSPARGQGSGQHVPDASSSELSVEDYL